MVANRWHILGLFHLGLVAMLVVLLKMLLLILILGGDGIEVVVWIMIWCSLTVWNTATTSSAVRLCKISVARLWGSELVLALLVVLHKDVFFDVDIRSLDLGAL